MDNDDQSPAPEKKPALPAKHPRYEVWAYSLIVAGIMGLICTGILYLAQDTSLAVPAAAVGVALIPFTIGFVAAFPWRDVPNSECRRWWVSLIITVFSGLGAAIVLHEGAVCLVMVAPLLWAAVYGGFCASLSSGKKDRRLQVSIVPGLLALLVADARIPSEKQGAVVDELIINAPPASVFPHVVQFPEITAPPSHWLNRFGLPAAKQSTSEGAFVGAKRACIFSNGLTFDEQITELIPGKQLTFIVTEQPRDPELFGHFDLHKGQFDLRDNGDGTTTLVGSSWYTLRVRPIWYFELWTKDIIRDVHLRVMKHIKTLAEADARRTGK
jgi:uncharacterized membrane protein YhaH (DUF805 family)